MNRSLVSQYLETQKPPYSAEALAYLAQLDLTRQTEPELARAVVAELREQNHSLKMIASENYSSLTTHLLMGNLLTDKYSEGIPGKRFYAGCEHVDTIEELASARARELFGAEYAYVQPHSGADANLIAFWAVLHERIELPKLQALGKKNLYDFTPQEWQELRTQLNNQKLLAMDYYSGGHLTHGYRYNVSGKMFDAYTYSVDPETGFLDYDALKKQAEEIRPLILLAGYSAYPRKLNFARLRDIADRAGAVLMVDMAHFAGLVAGKVWTGEYDPVPYADLITSTTHKTLRGPRGGLILAKSEFSQAVDKGCPLVIGGPIPNIIAAKAAAFTEAATPSFQQYAHRIVENSQTLARALMEEGIQLVTGGTDNHLLLLDLKDLGITGKQAESALSACRITLNRNSLPSDPNGPWYTSGLRLGTAALTTRGLGPEEMRQTARLIVRVLRHTQPLLTDSGKKSKSKYAIDPTVQQEIQDGVKKLLQKFPLYPELNHSLLYTLLE